MNTGNPNWKGQPILPEFKWEATNIFIRAKGAQALQFTVEKCIGLRNSSKASPSNKLFACKWYRTSDKRYDEIGGWKYIDREWQILRNLDHPNILQYKDFSYDPSSISQTAKLYTEYCSKGDLSQFNPKGKKFVCSLTASEAAQVFFQVAAALLYIHHGIYKTETSSRPANTIYPNTASGAGSASNLWKAYVHRDIKPDNIFVAYHFQGRIIVKLGDFGLATTDVGGLQTYVGTDAYRPPEQCYDYAGGRRTTPLGDIYSLGCTMDRVVPDSSGPLIGTLRRHISACTEYDDTSRPTSMALVDDLYPICQPSRTSNPQSLFIDAANLLRAEDPDAPQLMQRLCKADAARASTAAVRLQGSSRALSQAIQRTLESFQSQHAGGGAAPTTTASIPPQIPSRLQTSQPGRMSKLNVPLSQGSPDSLRLPNANMQPQIQGRPNALVAVMPLERLIRFPTDVLRRQGLSERAVQFVRKIGSPGLPSIVALEAYRGYPPDVLRKRGLSELDVQAMQELGRRGPGQAVTGLQIQPSAIQGRIPAQREVGAGAEEEEEETENEDQDDEEDEDGDEDEDEDEEDDNNEDEDDSEDEDEGDDDHPGFALPSPTAAAAAPQYSIRPAPPTLHLTPNRPAPETPRNQMPNVPFRSRPVPSVRAPNPRPNSLSKRPTGS